MQSVVMLNNHFSEEIFSQTPLMQLEAISYHPVISYLGGEKNPHLATTSFQRLVESSKDSPQPPFP